jgi:ABC-type transport system involved in multi-copper enzyme maturation permease subunit
MLHALSAEMLKMRRHKATWFLVWMFPIAFTAIMLIGIAAGMAGTEAPSSPDTAINWMNDTSMIWHVPPNSFGRLLIAAFVAVVFAGEYAWNTWKLVVPHRSRTSLIVAKFALVLGLYAAAFVLTALLTLAFSWLSNILNRAPLPSGITAGGLWDVHAKAALAALAPFLITVGYASLAAVLTRSTIAATVIAFIATTAEQLIFTFGPLLSIKFPAIVPPLYHALPGYHLANLSNWISTGAVLERPLPGTIVAHDWTVSAAVIALWVAALAGGALFAFRRQDIN